MNNSTQMLPEDYCQVDEINLSKNKGLSILLNLAAVVLFVPSLILLGLFLRWARPELTTNALTYITLDLVKMIALLVSVVLTMLVHEFIHGFFFWTFTRSRPVFALRPLYAYAAAPDWFIPARHYWIVGLAPLVIIDVIGLLLLFVAPPGWILICFLTVALNTAGAVGDLYIVARLLQLPAGSLVKDAGDHVSFFEPAAAISKSA